jgi:hypothetical protein
MEDKEKNESAAYKLQHFAANKNAIRQAGKIKPGGLSASGCIVM